MRKPARLASPLLAVLLLASPAIAADASPADTLSAQDIATLKAQIAQLTKKVDQLEALSKKTPPTITTGATSTTTSQNIPVAATTTPRSSPIAAVSAEDVVTKGTLPGSFRVPGTDTSVKIGGYVKLDAIEDTGESYGQSYAHFFEIPLKNSIQSQQSSQTTFGAQQSRINLETSTPSRFGEIRTFIEGDFFGSSAANSNTNAYGFALRHAYGSVGSPVTGQVLAGQTWSNFMDVAAMPETLDYIGPAGTLFVRQPQIRYTHALGPVTLSGSVEVAGNSIQSTQNVVDAITNSATAPTAATARTQMPDMIVHAQYDYAKDGYIGLRALANQINVDHTATDNNDTETKYGYGVAVSGKQGFWTKDNVNYDVVVGNGTGRYAYDIGGAGAYTNTTTNVLKTTPYYGGTFGFQHYWSNEFRSNVFGGMVHLVDDRSIMNSTISAAANKFVASGHANLIWQPVASYKVGIEYMHGYRKTESGIEGNLDRTEASFIYSF